MIRFLRRNPLFLKYWIASWFSELGDWFRNMSLMYMVLKLSNYSPTAVSFMLFCEFAPIFLFGPVIGVLADRWDRKKTIVAANVLRIGFVGMLMAAFFAGSLSVLYIGAFLCSLCTLLFRSPSSAFVMQFVAKEDLKTTSVLRQLSMSSLMLLGPALGTLVYMELGGEMALFINMLLMVANVALIQSIRITTKESGDEIEAKSEGVSERRGKFESLWTDFKAGFRYIAGNAIARSVAISCVFLGLGSGIVSALEVFVVTDFLKQPEQMLSVILTVQGVAMLLSAILVQRLKWPHQHLVFIGMVIMGLGFAGSVIYPKMWAVCAGIVIFSIGQTSLNVGMATLMQTRVDYAFQGRVGTAINTIFMGFMVVSLMGAGGLHSWVGLRPLFAGGGGFIVLGGLLCGYLFYLDTASEKKKLATEAVLGEVSR